MILRSPPGMKDPRPCRPGALTRRCERPGASIISSLQGLFPVARWGEGETVKRLDAAFNPNSEVEWERARPGRRFPRPRGKPRTH